MRKISLWPRSFAELSAVICGQGADVGQTNPVGFRQIKQRTIARWRCTEQELVVLAKGNLEPQTLSEPFHRGIKGQALGMDDRAAPAGVAQALEIARVFLGMAGDTVRRGLNNSKLKKFANVIKLC